MSILSGLTQRGPTPVLEKLAAFTEARHRVLTENIANVDTPGYREKQLDPAAFQAELRRASTARTEPSAPLELKSTRQVRIDHDGGMQMTPETEPADNVLFHDGTNARIERLMSSLAENGLTHQMSIELLRTEYAQMMSAIKGRVT